MELDVVRSLATSPLRSFLSKSYSLELLLMLEAEDVDSILDAYDSLKSPKPKKAAFDDFIRRQIANGFIELEESGDKRKKKLVLSAAVRTMLSDMSPNED